MAMANGGESLYERFDRRSVVSGRFKEIYTIRPTPSFCSRMKSPGVSAAREFALSRLVHFTKSLSTHPPYFEIAKEEGSNLGFAALPGIIVALTLRRSFSSVAILDNARFSRLKREAKGRVFKVLARGVVDDDKISKDKSNALTGKRLTAEGYNRFIVLKFLNERTSGNEQVEINCSMSLTTLKTAKTSIDPPESLRRSSLKISVVLGLSANNDEAIRPPRTTTTLLLCRLEGRQWWL
uniref:Uncharacterized protein n=1 Tax=Vespula pensylvanica TaxID=30213 RepID=A0A834NQF1_VESPE|nr:hypothetical protein H0235_012138 [Vespula pensylvanica]